MLTAPFDSPKCFWSGVQEYFELGVILLRKKLYTQATKNLEKAKKAWTGEPEELAQVRLAGPGNP